MGHGKSVPVVVFIPYYTDKSADRQREIDSCLAVNVNCNAISKIVLMIDDDSEPKIKSHKITIYRTKKRPTYQYWIDLSRQISYPCVSILANSDIYFNTTAGLFEECLKDERSFVALSRHDKIKGELVPHPDPHWSQDVWAMKFPAKVSKELYDALNIPLGVPRCDNRVAFLFKIHGWRVANPFRQIITTHVHETQLRNYDKKGDTRILGGVAYVHPCGLAEISDIDIDVWTLENAQIKTTKLNASLKKWLAERPDPAGIASQQIDEAKLESIEPAKNLKKNTLTRSVVHQIRDLSRKIRNKERPARISFSNDLIPENSLIESTDVSPVLPTRNTIKSRPPTPGDPHFWQYPCYTEKQAHDNHGAFPPGSNIDEPGRTIHTYLGLPWATYIDLRAPLDDLLANVRSDVEAARLYAKNRGYSLRVHSVCQHYAWDRIRDAFIKAGITDLHLSHCTDDIIASGSDALRFHSWPLFAPNIENPLRARGIEIGVPSERRQYLASFIGSQMPHYRSETRLAFKNEAIADGGKDLLVEITSLWHFNRDVYDEQVRGRILEQKFILQQLEDAERYNRVLSNSVFSLCPDGAGPNTLRLWESLAVGSIPVVIAKGWVPPPLGGADLEDACIFISESEVPGIYDRLRSMPKSEVVERMQACLNCYRAARQTTCFNPSYFSTTTGAATLETGSVKRVLAASA